MQNTNKRAYLERNAGRFASSAKLIEGIKQLDRDVKEMSRKSYKDSEVAKFRAEGLAKLRSEYSRNVQAEQTHRENVMMTADVGHQLSRTDPKVLAERQTKTSLFEKNLLAMSKSELQEEAQRVQMRRDVYFRSPDEHNAFVAECRRRGLESEADLTRAHLKANHFDEPWRLDHSQTVKEFETFAKIPEGAFPAFGKTESGEESAAAMEIGEDLLST